MRKIYSQLTNWIVKKLGAATSEEVAQINSQLEESQRVADAYRNYVDSILIYAGNYPAWKAQQEFRQIMSEQGAPVTGKLIDLTPTEATKAEYLDHYLGRVIDGLQQLIPVVSMPNSVTDDPFKDCDAHSKTRGMQYLKENQLPGVPDEDAIAHAGGESSDNGLPAREIYREQS